MPTNMNTIISSRFVLLSLLPICFTCLAFGATTLSQYEVSVMKSVAKTLGKDWDFDVHPCNQTQSGDNTIYCNCQVPNDSFCHVEKISLLGNRLTGPIPKELGNLITLTRLILEFNSLSGNLPSELGNLVLINQLYLSSNNFTGQLPEKLSSLTAMKDLDLSYNKLNGPVPGNLQELIAATYTNLFASFSRNKGPVSCDSSNRNCTKKVKSLHINCGGNQTTIGGITYDEDIYPAGPAVYQLSRNNWALSNTGHFLDNNTIPSGHYTTENETRLYMTDAELYKKARISPMSLTYYGFCLENGVYTVKLHFAEIMFTDDHTYSDLGRRVFDVYIQGERVLKDFNIAVEAQGVGKELIKQFRANVSGNDLEIRFYWAGKGTTNIPYKSVNGPLVSAISVYYDGFSFSILWWRGFISGCCLVDSCWHTLVEGLWSNSNYLAHFGVATNNFDISNKIGEGGFGPVYKGILPNSKPIAVKQLSSTSEQGSREFVNEIGMISALQHPNLVKLYGCCVEGDQLLLVYEYMENNSLARALFEDSEHSHLKLNWPTRQNICVGIARGLAFLHEESRLKVVHRDLKSSNVLLDEDLNPKISDFGLARLREGDNTHISTRIAGTWGYMAPEYAMHGYLTEKADVYSFGVVTLEIVSGKRNTIWQSRGEDFYLLDWAGLLKERGGIMELVDRKLGQDFNEDEVMLIVKVALLCTNVTSSLRPSMSSVVSMLEGRTMVPESVSHSSEVMDEMRLEVMREFYSQIDENTASETRRLSLTIGVPWTGSSSSATELNFTHLDASS
ncbi:unnamed protein product [Sphenostylis stenocarpa]|uniref:non-specific serine/threonine protein kinase n=1 Tax=Sphenostylis stenocarpa TaxID=92480 RepID=A0AA86SN94_9FABA|nr:unnamed protein product [Sphenostylis stenocarpa]